jgi:uncharacterized protein
MTRAVIGVCTIEFYLPGISSLKEKRSVLKSMLARLHNQFNVSTAEIDHHDVHQSALVAVAAVTNSVRHAEQIASSVLQWIEANYPEAVVVKEQTEVL